MIFKQYESDFFIKYNGVVYDFTHVESLAIEDPEMTRLTRGANGNNKEGLVYKEGIKEPKRVTVTIIDMPLAIKTLLDTIYNGQERCEVGCVARRDGSKKIARSAILCQEPRQLLVDETPESMNVALVFESFDLIEEHKS